MTTRNVNADFPVISASGSLNLSKLYNIYYFTPTANNIIYTYALPQITCDGQEHKIVRNDANSTCSLTITTVDTIRYGGTNYTSLVVNPRTVFMCVSYNQIWYVSKITDLLNPVGKSIFSGNYTANNSSAYQVFSGGTNLASAFTYLGSSSLLGGPVTNGIFSLQHIGGTVTVTLFMTDVTGITTMATTGAVSVPSGQLVMRQFSSVNQTLLPTSAAGLLLWITVAGGGGNKVGLGAFAIY